jgi:hypothetical protein
MDDACTLPTAERPLRQAEFDALFAGTVSVERLSPQHLRLHLHGNADLEASVRDLTRRETQCCSFFAFTVTAARPGRVTLDVEVPPGRVEILDGMAARAGASQ